MQQNLNPEEIEIDRLKVGVVGAGNWGTAIADLLGTKGFAVDLWAFEKEVSDSILKNRTNSLYLKGFILSDNIRPSNDLESVVADKDILVTAVPSHLLRGIAQRISHRISSRTVIVSASKGIETRTHLTMSGVLREVISDIPKNNVTVLSGPSFAKEVAGKTPTAVTVASTDATVGRFVQHVFAAPYFRVYTSDDIIGVELGGAVKNIIAITAGIIDGLELGLNTRAAMITRGLAEVCRLGLKLGANPHTFSGLAGIGDLILTCTGALSRNHTVGKQIGAGKPLDEILSEMRMIAEGVRTAESVYNLSRRLEVDMPICHETYHILYENLSPKTALQRLMARDLKQEREDG
jgi:glycerol-3-phosphate dehydrogenase (NAD(P)+)